ncbi:hypothetical protein M378DRAFT_133971 [Amanita muscaria Koide BX008]|uniref:Uncharacterized protein n=1 Tax=Amanita muscaria (strain Koide BX008) TaxID=946122 RepID=A0A0C2S0E4_AMAMK|nr:hypothetical protein M378DRAFT_133971 [Amanita muscaria Koide BX008]
MSIPSLVSDCPISLFCKRIAKSPSLFNAWKVGAKTAIILNPPVEVTDHFDKLYQLEEVPSTLVQGPLLTLFIDHEPEFQLTVRTWASTIPPVEGDEYGILPALHILALAYSRVRKTSNNHSSEHTQRRSINEIIEFAFSARRDRHCDFKYVFSPRAFAYISYNLAIRTEESYRLVASAGNPDAQSDALVTIPSPIIGDKLQMHQLSFRGDPSILQHLYWSTGGERNGFSIIGFAGEFKKDDDDCNQNQLIMVLATAQSQRKALSLKPSIIMGAIACRGRVQMFSSYWTSDGSSICIYPHEQRFDLSDPIQLIRLYVFCSKLERLFQGTLALELETWNTPTKMTLQSHMWRSPDHSRKRRRTETGESGSGSNGGRGGGNSGLVDADGFDGDWHMNVMKWRDGVVKDGKEGRVVSDEDNILDAASGWLQFEGRVIAPLS